MDIVNSKKLRLEVYDMNKRILGILTDKTEYSVDDLKISESTNDTTKISFPISSKNEKSKYLINENLVKLDGEYYVVKKPIFDNEEEEFTIECEHESVRLKEVLLGKISYIAETAESLITKVLSRTDWIFGGTDIPNTKKRHLETDELSVFANLVEIANNFNARLKFSIDTSTGKEIKSVSLYYSPIDNGRYIKNNRDLNSANISYDSSEMVTRLYVYGKTDDGTGREINMMEAHPNNLPYVEDFSYFKDLGYTDKEINSNKDLFVKELILRVSSLYTPQEVYEYAKEEIARLCYPRVEANINALDVSCDDKFMKKPFQIGEIINVVDTKTNLILGANIASISRDYENPLDVDMTISNVIEKNSTLKRMSQSSEIIEKIIDSGTDKIHGTYIKEATISSAHLGKAIIEKAHIGQGVIDSAHIDKADIQEAILEKGIIKSAHIDDAQIKEAHIDNASITNVKIVDLDAEKINFGTATGNIIDVQTLLARFISGDNAHLLNLTGDNVVVDDAFVKDLIAKHISVGDLKAGSIDTNDFNIVSDNGGLKIVGATQQFRDRFGNVRLQLGQDAEGNFSFILKGVDGTTTLIDEKGVKENAIADKLIKEDMIADNAIGERQVNYSSFVTGLNKDENSELIKASKVAIDLEGQTLDISFKQLNTNIDNINSQKMYRVVVESTNGILFKNDNIQTILKARVYSWDTEITNEVPSSCFTWTRKSKDTASDEYWNSQYGKGIKEIVITSDDVTDKAVFNCEVDI